VQLAVTSPPYFGKVHYGPHLSEHGRGTLEAYIAEMLAMSAEVHRVLDDQGVFYLNVGETMANSGGAGGDHSKGGRKAKRPKYRQGASGIVGNQHALVPERIAIALQDQGWLIRRRIVWEKDGVLRPEDLNHVRRPLDQHEIILMLAKSKRYRYRPEAHEMLGIPKGDVWSIRPVRNKTGHPAPFPAELPRRAILLSSSPGDIVIDPYVGSGTTIHEAARHKRIGLGFDLYAGMWEKADGYVRVGTSRRRRTGTGAGSATRGAR
jgi:DNA modification methylase